MESFLCSVHELCRIESRLFWPFILQCPYQNSLYHNFATLNSAQCTSTWVCPATLRSSSQSSLLANPLRGLSRSRWEFVFVFVFVFVFILVFLFVFSRSFSVKVENMTEQGQAWNITWTQIRPIIHHQPKLGHYPWTKIWTLPLNQNIDTTHQPKLGHYPWARTLTLPINQNIDHP